MIRHSQPIVSSRDGTTLYLVSAVDGRGPARLVAITPEPPADARALPPLTLDPHQIEAYAEFAPYLPRLGSAPATDVQLIYGPQTSLREQRPVTLYWSLPEGATLNDGDRATDVAGLFAHGGLLVGVEFASAPRHLRTMPTRKISAGVMAVLAALAPQLPPPAERPRPASAPLAA
jgi:hypothetical protein